MEDEHRTAADAMRARLERGACEPGALRAALASVPGLDRDAWIDVALGLEPPSDDGPALPAGCVPYLPCSVNALVATVDGANVTASDIIVDVGSGAGRAAAVFHLLSGARIVGVEIQPELVAQSRELASRLRLSRMSFVDRDATTLPPEAREGTVFFLYCPFSGARLDTFFEHLQALARERTLRVACVDVPIPERSWLQRIDSGTRVVDIARSAVLRPSPCEP